MGQLPDEVLRARRTASVARATLALSAIILLAVDHGLSSRVISAVGFAIIAATAAVQIAMPNTDWLKLEESLAPLSAILIIGLGPQRVGVLTILWLAAVASGVIARGGRVGGSGRALLLAALALPIVRDQTVTPAYAGLVLAAIALLLTCGRMTRELRGMLERARFAADHDDLTEALTRAAFRDRLDRVAGEHRLHRNLAVLLVDLDNFGAINKSSGHAAGDAVLISVVGRLGEVIAEGGIVARLGGDEFGVLVSNPDPHELARRIVEDLDSGREGQPRVSACVGIALCPRDGKDAETLLRAVDVALRVAKRTGRRQVSMYAGESLSTPGARGAQEALQRLISGEGLTIAVQPIVTTAGRRTHAYEALARFQGRGTSNPLHWFALADEFGLRDELELACLARALELLPGRPEGTLLSVNLSGPLLLDERTQAVLRERDSLSGLILELTENSLLEDTPGLHTEISELQAAGVRFAVDDMGAGYSGLRQMTTVRPSYMKLDRSLISGIDQDPDRGALISALISYARQTGGHLVAEGVETEAELSALTQLGVELVQGFHVARPSWPWPGAKAPVENWEPGPISPAVSDGRAVARF
ncbi:MAG: EAL domain-containing protein [Actinomycetota bacterium]|nr:EAL domain-containing protein [Actinomycetota bacterium]